MSEKFKGIRVSKRNEERVMATESVDALITAQQEMLRKKKSDFEGVFAKASGKLLGMEVRTSQYAHPHSESVRVSPLDLEGNPDYGELDKALYPLDQDNIYETPVPKFDTSVCGDELFSDGEDGAYTLTINYRVGTEDTGLQRVEDVDANHEIKKTTCHIDGEEVSNDDFDAAFSLLTAMQKKREKEIALTNPIYRKVWAIMDAHNQIRSFDNIIDLVWDVKSRHREVSFSWIPADVLKTAVEIVEQKSTENLEECLLAWREFFARRRFTGEEIGYCEIYSHKTNFYRGEFIGDDASDIARKEGHKVSYRRVIDEANRFCVDSDTASGYRETQYVGPFVIARRRPEINGRAVGYYVSRYPEHIMNPKNQLLGETASGDRRVVEGDYFKFLKEIDMILTQVKGIK